MPDSIRTQVSQFARFMMYFGYGSLVNRSTRSPKEPSVKATLRGWQREWAHRAARPWTEQGQARAGVCALTIAPRSGCQIDGVLAEVDDQDIAALDRREQGYTRLTLPIADFSLAQVISAESICVYVSSSQHYGWADAEYPVPRTYIDCVLAGFFQQYGEAGARRFMRSTLGWERPMVDDRAAPLYPRAVRLESKEKTLIELLLNER